nr:retrotransposon protein, putative, Ty1-copia subclass [Tanacetum cinerariifolium]
MMHKKFQMSSMGELTFFLRLQVKQKEDGIFISQDKYVNEILNKFGFSDVKTASTPMETHKTLLKDEKEKIDYAGESLDRKSTTGGCQFLRCELVEVLSFEYFPPSSTKVSIMAKDTNPSQPLVSTSVIARMHKEIVFSASTIVHFKSAFRHDTLVDSTAEDDLGKSAPNDFLSKQQGNDKGTQNYSIDNIIACNNPNVLVDKTKSARDRLETAHTITGTDKETNNAKKEASYD